jgi:hypothetical protein
LATITSIFIASSDGNFVLAPGGNNPVVMGTRQVFSINADADINITFYSSLGGTKTATATNWRVPANIVATFDMSDYYDTISVFSTAGANVWYLKANRS